MSDILPTGAVTFRVTRDGRYFVDNAEIKNVESYSIIGERPTMPVLRITYNTNGSQHMSFWAVDDVVIERRKQ